MGVKQRLYCQLKRARDYSEGLLAAFKSPQEWVHQVHPNANHALWFAGHMATSDNFFLSLVAPDKTDTKPQFQSCFGMGSQPTANLGDYPDPEEVLGYMRDRRRQLMQVLEGLGEDDLSRSLPQGAPDFLSDFASVFELAIWHEGLHSGQVSVARRSLGNAPLGG
ncbi:MAG: DinB family protein [Planctomycetes bacterium]|nr:DinB family protein [Planctomycetota bacterium]